MNTEHSEACSASALVAYNVIQQVAHARARSEVERFEVGYS
jgi:hypothetical protein